MLLLRQQNKLKPRWRCTSTTGYNIYTNYEWAYKSHEPPKEIKRQSLNKKDKVTYAAKVKFDVTKTKGYSKTFKCTLAKGHSGDHEGGVFDETCEKTENYTETREYKTDVLVDKGGAKPPTDEYIEKWAEQEAQNRS